MQRESDMLLRLEKQQLPSLSPLPHTPPHRIIFEIVDIQNHWREESPPKEKKPFLRIGGHRIYTWCRFVESHTHPGHTRTVAKPVNMNTYARTHLRTHTHKDKK